MCKPIVAVLSMAILAAVVSRCPAASGPGAGQADLDKATEIRTTAATVKELGDVVQLVESALKKGLDEDNAAYAKKLLASTLISRAQETTKHIFTEVVDSRDFRDRRQSALDDLDKSIKLDGKQPQAYLLAAQLNMLPGGAGVKDVRDALDRAIDLGIDDPAVRAKALVLRAGLQERREKKLADFDEAIKLVPNDSGTIRSRGYALSEAAQVALDAASRLPPDQKDKAARLMREAAVACQRALADFDRAIELDPEDEPTFEAKAMLLAQMGRYDAALAALDRARQLNPESAGPLLQRARIHSLQRKLDAALEDLNQACAMDPGNVPALLMRASVHFEKGERAKALADLDQTLRLKPDLPMALHARAWYLMQEGKLDEAAADLERLLRIDPKDLQAMLKLGTLFALQRKPEKAIGVYSGMLAIEPRLWQALHGRGDAYLALGKYAEALADYEKAVQLAPRDDGMLANLAWLLATAPDAKVRDGRRALRLAGDACRMSAYKRPPTLAALAAAYAETGDFDAAMKWVRKAVELGGKEWTDVLTRQLESYKLRQPWREPVLAARP